MGAGGLSESGRSGLYYREITFPAAAAKRRFADPPLPPSPFSLLVRDRGFLPGDGSRESSFGLRLGSPEGREREVEVEYIRIEAFCLLSLLSSEKRTWDGKMGDGEMG